MILARRPTGRRPFVVAIDGRSAAGKSTLTSEITARLPSAAVLHTDDLAWHEPLFQWPHHLQFVLDEVAVGRGLSWTPPQWAARGRQESIEVPADVDVLLVEGVGSGDARVTGRDLLLWVESDRRVAEERGIARDMASGERPERADAEEFWHWWSNGEEEHLALDRPWERADLCVLGTPTTRRPGWVEIASGTLDCCVSSRM